LAEQSDPPESAVDNTPSQALPAAGVAPLTDPPAANLPAAQVAAHPPGMRFLERIAQLVGIKNGSDIHLLEGERPRLRLHGDLLSLDAKEHPLITRQDIQDVLDYALDEEQKRQFTKNLDVDFSLEFGGATGRVNVGFANGRRMHLVMRYLRSEIIPIDSIGINVEMLKKLAGSESGVIIVAGETSSGKTTTIAAMLDYINHTRYASIQTIENPVEYSFKPDRCLITRREIGRDTPNFQTALRASVRKNPDVLLIGEVRDEETANIVLSASETGIQTFCTLHAIGAIPAIVRLRNIMTNAGHNTAEFYQRLAQCLHGILSQQLVKSVSDGGVLPIYEILNVEYAEKNYLREADFTRLEQSLETDRNISMGKCIYELWHRNPRPINEDTIHRVFGDQFHLVMNRLESPNGWKPLATGI
jgi:twitching motility protein PilT